MVMQRTVPVAGELPRKGHLLPDVWLTDVGGASQSLSSLRGDRTAVVVAAGTHGKEFAETLAEQIAEFEAEKIAVFVIVPGTNAPHLQRRGLRVLSDANGSAHLRLAGPLRDGVQPWAAYVTDQYGEIYALFTQARGDALPKAKELLEWAKFVNIRCEECFPPEWPDTP